MMTNVDGERKEEKVENRILSHRYISFLALKASEVITSNYYHLAFTAAKSSMLHLRLISLSQGILVVVWRKH